MVFYSQVPNRMKQTFTRIRRTTGGGQDAYGDATFTESQTTGFRGFVQIARGPGQTVTIDGKEIAYDLVLWTSATFIGDEEDVILFGSSASQSVATRYHIRAVRIVYDGSTADHTQMFCTKEVT